MLINYLFIYFYLSIFFDIFTSLCFRLSQTINGLLSTIKFLGSFDLF